MKKLIGRNRRVLAAAVPVAAIAAASLVSAAPAQATVSNGCDVRALTPGIMPYLDELGRKVAQYPLSIKCNQAARVEVDMQRVYEQDNGKPGDSGGNDLIANYVWVWAISPGPFTKTFYPKVYVGNWDSDSKVELFHNARFRVCSFDGVICGPWVMTANSSVITVTP